VRTDVRNGCSHAEPDERIAKQLHELRKLSEAERQGQMLQP
jgi:hypothetical protein